MKKPTRKKAAFGHDITEDDWRLIHSIVDAYTEMLFCSPLISVNVAHPLIKEIDRRRPQIHLPLWA